MRRFRSLSLRALFLTLFCSLFAVTPAFATESGPPTALNGGVLTSGSKLLVAVQGGTTSGVIDAGFPNVSTSSNFYSPGAIFGIRVGTTNYSQPSGGMTQTQAPVRTGTGTTADPWIVTSAWTIPGFQVTQKVRMVNGARSYRVTRSIRNTGTSAASFKAFEGADLYVQGKDQGAGVYSATAPRTVGGIAADGTKAELLEVTPWTHYREAEYSTIIGVFSSNTTYDDTIDTNAGTDNGAGVQWDVNNLAAGATTDLAVTWQFVSAGSSPAPTNPPTIGTNPGPTSGPTATFTWSTTDPNTAGYQCRLDNGAYDPCTSPYTTPTLPSGPHTLQIQPINAEGNDGPVQTYNWTADATAPLAPTINSAPNGSVNSSTAMFTWTGAEAGGSYQCQIDNGGWTPCTSPRSYTGLSESAHQFDVRQIDAGGNIGPAASRNFTVDMTPPPAPVINPATRPSFISNSASLNLSFSGEAGGTFTCTLDDVATACTSPFTRTLADGTHQFFIYQTDSAGNVSPVTAFIWTIDTIAPAAPTLSGAPTAHTQSTDFTITVDKAETGGTLQCRLDGGSWNPCTSPISASGLVDGNHSFSTRQLDNAGNVGAVATASWNVDTTAPSAPGLIGFPAEHASSNNATFSFSGENNAVFTCSLDGGTFGPCPSPYAVSGLDEGSHTLLIKQTDQAGNTSSAQSYTWTVDTVAPAVPSFGDVPSAHSNSADAEITFNGAETDASYQCRLNGGSWNTCISPLALTGLSDGDYTLDIRQVDQAGNVSGDVSTSWNIDTAAPAALSVTGEPETYTNTDSTRFEFAGEANSTYICTFNGSPVSCNTPGITVTAVEGSNEFSVRQVDQAGNASAPYSYTWTLDTVDPITTVVPGVNGSVVSVDYVDFNFSTDDTTNVQHECRLDNGSWNSCSANQTFAQLSDGSHTLSVRATDQAGNVGDVKSATFTVDTTGPETTVSDKPAVNSSSSTARFVFSATDATTSVASYECRFGTGDWNPCSSPVDLTGLSEGSNTFAVRSIDTASNTGIAVVTTWNVDLGNPTVSLDTKPTADSSQKTPSFVVSASDSNSGIDTVECRVDGGSWSACGAQYTVSGELADGDHVFEYRATDNSGRVSDIGRYEWTVDTSASVSVTSPSNNAHVSTNRPTIAFSGDKGAQYQVTLNGNIVGSGTVDSTGSVTVQPVDGLDDGAYTFNVSIDDVAGNTATTSVTVVIDTVAPVKPSFTDKPSSKTNLNDAHFEFTGETNTNFECKLDTGSWAPCSSPVDFVSVADGDHTFSVRSVDAAGNTGNEESYSWTVDRDTSVDLVSPRPGLTGTATQTVVVTGEVGATVSIKVDGVEVATGTIDANGDLSVALDKLSDGNHTVSVVVTDGAGNTDTEEAVITVDTAAPNTATVTEQPASMSSSKTATFTFASDAGTTYKCRVDGGQYVPCSSPFTVNDLVEGPHTFSVVAIDEAGNEGARQDVSWSVDTVKPTQPPVVTGPEKATDSRNATFDVQVEPGSTLLCSVDGGAYAPCSSPITLTGLSTGAHSLKFKQVDEAGNEGAVTEYNWTVSAGGNTDTGKRPTRLNTALAGKITVRNNRQVTVGCQLNRPSIRKCVVDLYVPVASSKSGVTGAKMVKIGSGVTTVKAAGKRSAPVAVKLNNRGRALLKRAIGGLKAVAQVKATARTGEAFNAQLKTVLYPQAVIVMPTTSVSFAFNNAKLNKVQHSYIRSIAANVRDAKAITCVGYTDSRGSDSYNKKLSAKRAKNVCAALRKAGVRAKFVSVGRGEKNPRATNKTDKGRKANRRVVLTVKY